MMQHNIVKHNKIRHQIIDYINHNKNDKSEIMFFFSKIYLKELFLIKKKKIYDKKLLQNNKKY